MIELAGGALAAVGLLLMPIGTILLTLSDGGAFAILTWTLAALAALVTGLAVIFAGEGMRERAGRGHCPECDYDLRGQREGGCPECGWSRTVR